MEIYSRIDLIFYLPVAKPQRASVGKLGGGSIRRQNSAESPGSCSLTTAIYDCSRALTVWRAALAFLIVMVRPCRLRSARGDSGMDQAPRRDNRSNIIGAGGRDAQRMSSYDARSLRVSLGTLSFTSITFGSFGSCAMAKPKCLHMVNIVKFSGST